MKNDNFILINEVGLRDGLQGVSQEVTIEQRLKIIRGSLPYAKV